MPLTRTQLERKAFSIRKKIISMLLQAGSGHSAGPLGMTDVYTALYFAVLKHDPKNPTWENRDRVILSNGHTCPVLYVTLAEAGYFQEDELYTLRTLGSRLQGHPHLGSLPGVENTSGPLGQGLSQAAGLAYSFKRRKKNNHIFCLCSDGELQEGQTWEALLFTAKNRLHNLTVLVDRNNIQIDGYTEDIMPLHPVAEKFESFNWNVLEIDGHNIEAIVASCHQAKSTQEQPTVIICNTIPGKGVEFMENLPEWHGKPPELGEAIDALQNLRSLQNKLEGEWQ